MGGSLGEQLQSAIEAATKLMPSAVDSEDNDYLNLDWKDIDREVHEEPVQELEKP